MKSNKPLARKLNKAAKELGYSIKGPLAIKGEDKKFLFQYLKEAEFGIGHNAPDSLHNTNIEGYNTIELEDEVSNKTNKPITRKQLTDQRLYQERCDIMDKAEKDGNLVYESHMSPEGESEDSDGLTGSEQFDAAMYAASIEQQEEVHVFMARYGQGKGVSEYTPVIQMAFLDLIAGDIHKVGIKNAKKSIQRLYTQQLAAYPEKSVKLQEQLDNALNGLKGWYNLETQYLTAKGLLELDKAELELVNSLPADQQAAKKTEIVKNKRIAREEGIKNRA